jgi:hypothetical protein
LPSIAHGSTTWRRPGESRRRTRLGSAMSRRVPVAERGSQARAGTLWRTASRLGCNRDRLRVSYCRAVAPRSRNRPRSSSCLAGRRGTALPQRGKPRGAQQCREPTVRSSLRIQIGESNARRRGVSAVEAHPLPGPNRCGFVTRLGRRGPKSLEIGLNQRRERVFQLRRTRHSSPKSLGCALRLQVYSYKLQNVFPRIEMGQGFEPAQQIFKNTSAKCGFWRESAPLTAAADARPRPR